MAPMPSPFPITPKPSVVVAMGGYASAPVAFAAALCRVPVFVAEQERPIRRKVALKVIQPGMDSKAVVARFEAERQALALMDHPNIAKVLDAGTTSLVFPCGVSGLRHALAKSAARQNDPSRP